MKSYIVNGWKSVKDQFYVMIIMFLYQLLWGYFLYRLIDSAVVPLLMRYPDPPPTELSQVLYYVEGQMSLTQSSTVHTYLWVLLGMVALRMLLTPFIHAGIFYGLHREHQGERGLFFFQGMKLHGKTVFLFHLIEWVLIAAPLYWIIPKMYPILLSAIQNHAQLLHCIPYIAVWLLYCYIVHQMILFMQFGKTGGTSMFSSLWICLRSALPVIGISVLLGAVSLLLYGITSSVSLIWAGLATLIIQQGYHMVSCIFKLWNISSQYDLWHQQMNRPKKNISE
ncbi:hypothetical protein P4H83_32885 [Paenibacillus favisporus]|uniref:hypothetical protein n=1 Tax=Paenibacillus favisporus TaxID=221028 RepID=UPI002DB9CD2A|nr:hypothetical protein [Paenibacillus favisporus]MEC0179677.1 hypothetical protein [Paenibacillus favisporus]